MRNVQMLEDDIKLKQLAEEAATGQPVTLLQGDRPIAQIIPFPAPAITEEQRLKAGEELLAILEKGFDLGGLRIENRDELYEREYGDDRPVHV